MKKAMRLISALLCCMLLLMFVGCNDTAEQSGTSSSGGTTGSTPSGEDEKDYPRFDEPELKDMGGKTFTVATMWPTEWQEPGVEASEASKNFYNGLKQVEEMYKCTIKIRALPGLDTVIQYVSAGNYGVGDVIQSAGSDILTLIRQGYVQPIDDFPTFSKQPWPEPTAEFTTYFGKTYGFDYRYTIRQTMVFNKTLAESYGFGNLYEMVENKTWTIDKFIEICRATYEKSGNKTVGLTMPDYNMERSITGFIEANASPMIAEQDGKLVFTGNQQGAIDILGKLQSLYVDGLIKHTPVEADWDKGMEKDRTEFLTARASMFYLGELWEIQSGLNTNDDEFGLLPIPNGAENMDYIGLVGDGQPSVFIKGNPNNEDMALLMHAIAYYACQDTVYLDNYVESTAAFLCDDESMDMLELQLTNPKKSIFYACGAWEVGSAVRQIVTGQASPKEGMETVTPNVQVQLDEAFATLYAAG